jgi:hypothetical protein
MDGQRAVARNADLSPKPVDGKAFDEVLDRIGFAVEKQVVAIGPYEEVEQAFALRR